MNWLKPARGCISAAMGNVPQDSDWGATIRGSALLGSYKLQECEYNSQRGAQKRGHMGKKPSMSISIKQITIMDCKSIIKKYNSKISNHHPPFKAHIYSKSIHCILIIYKISMKLSYKITNYIISPLFMNRLWYDLNVLILSWWNLTLSVIGKIQKNKF